jgi:hypothetical protein
MLRDLSSRNRDERSARNWRILQKRVGRFPSLSPFILFRSSLSAGQSCDTLQIATRRDDFDLAAPRCTCDLAVLSICFSLTVASFGVVPSFGGISEQVADQGVAVVDSTDTLIAEIDGLLGDSRPLPRRDSAGSDDTEFYDAASDLDSTDPSLLVRTSTPNQGASEGLCSALRMLFSFFCYVTEQFSLPAACVQSIHTLIA